MSDQETGFPFEFWSKLAADDPSVFEQTRLSMIDSLIESAPEPSRQRLRGLQWQIDHVRDSAANPLGACLRISSMMWEKVVGEDGLTQKLDELSGRRESSAPSRQAAEILPFRRVP